MEGSHPAMPAEPGTLKVSLATMPAIEKITEKESAHPSPQQLNQLTRFSANGVATSPPQSPTDPTSPTSGQNHFKEVRVDGVESPTCHLTNANEDELCTTNKAAPSLGSTSDTTSSNNDKNNQCQTTSGDGNGAASGTKMARSISMPLSKDSPGLKSSRNSQLTSGAAPHGGPNQMQRSFSVLSSQVKV